MEIKIESAWATKLVSMLITRLARKKLGKDASIQVNSVTLNSVNDEELKLHVDIDAIVTKNDLQKLLLG